MVGGTLLFNYSEQVKTGFGFYGAVSGERGGFITLGLAAEVNKKIIYNWSTEAGLFVGAGWGGLAVGTGLVTQVKPASAVGCQTPCH